MLWACYLYAELPHVLPTTEYSSYGFAQMAITAGLSYQVRAGVGV